jgi:hypothetical protein
MEKTIEVMNPKLAEITFKLTQAALAGDIKEIVNLLHFNKSFLSKRDSKVFGVISFGEIETLIDELYISNAMNREEELDSQKSFEGKLSHAIRYVDGISRKSHLQLSYIPNKGEMLYISDDGTMMSLLFGHYRNVKKVNASNIELILNDISDNYELDGSEEFYNSIQNWLDGLSEQERLQKYSLDDIIRLTSAKLYFNSTRINFEINTFTTRQHIKDQQNANLQQNAWIPHNFYKAPIKALDAYNSTFMGDSLQSNVFAKVVGIGCDASDKADRLFRNYMNGKKKTETDIPFYTTYGALILTDNIANVYNYNKYFSQFAKHEHSEIGRFWYKTYDKLVNEVSYSDMVEHVRKMKIIQEGGWDAIRSHLRTMISASNMKSFTAWEDIRPFKDDFGMYVSYVILALNKLYPNALSRTDDTNLSKIKAILIDKIKEQLDGDFDSNTTLFDEFANGGYTSWDSRFEYIWEPAIKEVVKVLQNKNKSEKGFDREVNHQKDAIINIIRNNEWSTVFKCYSHISNELLTVNFTDAKKTMAGLHCVPVDNGGTASDGIIWGLTEDNGGAWKYKNLNELFDRPSDYWVSLAERNTIMLDKNKSKLSSVDIRSIERFITLCDTIGINGINYVTKK